MRWGNLSLPRSDFASRALAQQQVKSLLSLLLRFGLDAGARRANAGAHADFALATGLDDLGTLSRVAIGRDATLAEMRVS